MRVELLGTVQVRDDAGSPVHVGGPRAQALLALLAQDAGRVVSAGSLIDRLWDGEPPDGARGALQSMISRLRRVLGTAIESHPAGYRLALSREQVDALAFEELVGQGSRALADGDPAGASAVLRQALALWRGPALGSLPATERPAGSPPGWRSCGAARPPTGSRPTWPRRPWLMPPGSPPSCGRWSPRTRSPNGHGRC